MMNVYFILYEVYLTDTFSDTVLATRRITEAVILLLIVIFAGSILLVFFCILLLSMILLKF